MLVPSVALAVSILLAMPSAPSQDARKSLAVVNQVEGQTAILTLVPEGTAVKKGDVVCELDSALLRDRLTNQEIAVAQAKADAQSAKRAVEVAKVAAKESEGATAQEISATEGEIRVAELDIKSARQKLEDAKLQQASLQGRGELDKATSDLARAEANLGRGRAKLKRIRDFTAKKRKIEADAKVKQAQSESESQDAILKIQADRAEKLRRQIAACTLVAPIDGRVEYANPQVPRPDGYQIEEGALVRLKQTILRVVAE